MPRKPDHFKKSGPALAPGKSSASQAAGDERRVIHTPAGAAPFKAPPGAVNSVFGMAPPAEKRPRLALDPTTIKVHKGLPLPPSLGGSRTSKYATVWTTLAKGDCAELPDRQAAGFVSWAKKQKHTVAIRRLSPTTKGVWRLA